MTARDWLLVLCGYLAVWQPLTFAAEVTGTIGTLTMRGPAAVIELGIHACITAFAVAVAWGLWIGNPNAPAMAEAAVACCTMEVLQSLSWSRLPHDIAPGDRMPIALAAIAHATGWIVYLRRSRRVRSLYWN